MERIRFSEKQIISNLKGHQLGLHEPSTGTL
jgi:hypothetical protein